MTDPNENLPLGGAGAPGGTPNLGIEAEERALHKGRGRMIFGAIVFVLLGVGGLVMFMVAGQTDDQYADLGKHLNGVDRENFDPFWGCTFQGVPEVHSNTDIEYQIAKRAQTGRRRYAKLVRERCMPMLNPMRPALETMLAPQEVSGQVRQLAARIGALQGAWSEFIAYLDQGEYDEEDARPYLGKISKGWYDYRIGRGALAKVINKKLGRRVGTE